CAPAQIFQPAETSKGNWVRFAAADRGSRPPWMKRTAGLLSMVAILSRCNQRADCPVAPGGGAALVPVELDQFWENGPHGFDRTLGLLRRHRRRCMEGLAAQRI